MKKRSIGLIETRGFTPAVAAADAGAKAANVTLLGCRLTWPALATVTFQGDVAAVRAAVASGTAAAQAVGEVIATHVIARPNADYEHDSPVNEDPFAGEDRGEPIDSELKVPAVEETKKPAPGKKSVTKKRAAPAKKKSAPAKTVKKTTADITKGGRTAPKQSADKAETVEEKRGAADDTAETDQEVAPEQTGTTPGKSSDGQEADLSGQVEKPAAGKASQPAKRKRTVSRRRPVRQRKKSKDNSPVVDTAGRPKEAKPVESVPITQEKKGASGAQQQAESDLETEKQTKPDEKTTS